MAKTVAKKQVTISLAFAYVTVAVLFSFFTGMVVYGEQGGSSPESGSTSNIKSLYSSLQSVGYGSDTNTPNWGTYWNRISTASQWVPSGDAGVKDVAEGKTFYSSSRVLQTGTGNLHGVCSTQQYPDNHASATQANNCTAGITWTTPSDGVTGTDKQDPQSGLIWSQPLLNSAGTIIFTSTVGSDFTWDASGPDNTSKTASQLCSDRGNGWRLPSQKEQMHAYIDGANFNLIRVNSTYWNTATYSSTEAWYIMFNDGSMVWGPKNGIGPIRCVR